MPKHIKLENRKRFRIIGTDNEYYAFYIEERKPDLLGIWERWKILKAHAQTGAHTFYFTTLDEAKAFIDKKIEKEDRLEESKTAHIHYYP